MKSFERFKIFTAGILPLLISFGLIASVVPHPWNANADRIFEERPVFAGAESEVILERFSLSDSRYRNGENIDPLEIEINSPSRTDSGAAFTFLDEAGNYRFRVLLGDIDTAYTGRDGKVNAEFADGMHRFFKLADDLFEWEIILDKIPDTNRLNYPVETGNLIFYYQPPDTFAAHRDDWHYDNNVPGSYAVYRQNSGRNTGKAFHIFRPKAWDLTGDTIWCDLYIDSRAGLLKIELPQSFLEDAAYPITVDPVFGYTNRGATGVHLNAQNYRHLVNYNYPQDASGSMLKAYICSYKINPAAACTATVIVYSYDSSLADCGRIATSQKIPITVTASSPAGAEWLTGSISGALVDSLEYIVSWQGQETANYTLRVCADYTGISGAERYYNYSSWGTNDNLAGYSSSGYRYSVYVEYQEAAGEGDPYIRYRKIKRGNR